MKTTEHQVYKKMNRLFNSWVNNFLVQFQMQIVFDYVWKKISQKDKDEYTPEMLEAIGGQFYELYCDGYLK